jgi:hypothetical protein
VRFLRPLLAAVIWSVCGYVLAYHVGDVAVSRTRLIASPMTAFTGLDLAVHGLDSRVARMAFVCRVRNDDDRPLSLSAEFAGDSLGTRTGAPGQTVRLDFSGRNTDGRLRLVGDRPWTLNAAEAASVHGFSRGVLNLTVAPAGSRITRQPIWLLAAFFSVVGVLAFVTAVPLSPAWAWGHRAACTLTVLLFVVVGASPVASDYFVVLSPRSFVLGCAVLLLPTLAGLLGWMARFLSGASRLSVISIGIVAAAFFASGMAEQLGGFDGNYSGFLHLSEGYVRALPFLDRYPELKAGLMTERQGYDGQFVWGMAFDPALRALGDDIGGYRRVADAPPYRYGSAGFSALVAGSSLGQPAWFAAVQVWLAVLGHLWLAIALAAFARDHGWHPASALAYLAIPGFMASLSFALPESIAAAGLAGGMVCWHRKRVLLAAACFGTAGLIRETVLLVPACIALAEVVRHRRVAARGLCAAFLPAALWRAYVWTRLSPLYGASAFFYSPGDLGPPFAGLIRLVWAGWTGSQPGTERLAALTLPLILVLLLAIALRYAWRQKDGLSLAAVGYGLVAVSLNYQKIWSHVPSGERGTYEAFLCVFMLALADGRLSGKVLAAAFGVLALFTLLASPEAGVSRAALLLMR